MDKWRNLLKIQDFFVYTPVWKIDRNFHRYPQAKKSRQISTGDVNKRMLIMWITWWIMWIECDIC